MHRFHLSQLAYVVSSLRRRAMRRFDQYSRVRASLALFLHAQRCLRQKFSRTMVRKPHSAGYDLISFRQRCCVSFPQLRVSIFQACCRGASIISHEASGTSIFQLRIGVASIFSPHGGR
ncbi:hypothetical protein NDU88_010593 [Pleurodeles waltl]|uniref:Uncharacterized protein n=1 Tax=Pleurodeles waltl TaxID=8319 RepID=A0AAV7QW53_PLEWA|nr:hypothetical protein NDU88_010593 [Pleurodeles waltl]